MAKDDWRLSFRGECVETCNLRINSATLLWTLLWNLHRKLNSHILNAIRELLSLCVSFTMCGVGHCSRPGTCPSLSGSCSNANVHRVCLSLLRDVRVRSRPVAGLSQRRPASMWGLWWKKCHWVRFFSEYIFWYFPVGIIWQVHHMHLPVYQRTKRRRMGALKLRNAVSHIGKPWTSKVLWRCFTFGSSLLICPVFFSSNE